MAAAWVVVIVSGLAGGQEEAGMAAVATRLSGISLAAIVAAASRYSARISTAILRNAPLKDLQAAVSRSSSAMFAWMIPASIVAMVVAVGYAALILDESSNRLLFFLVATWLITARAVTGATGPSATTLVAADYSKTVSRISVANGILLGLGALFAIVVGQALIALTTLGAVWILENLAMASAMRRLIHISPWPWHR